MVLLLSFTVEMTKHMGITVREYTERLIQEAIIHGDTHKPTMELADWWLEDKSAIHKLFKVIVPRMESQPFSYTRLFYSPTQAKMMINSAFLKTWLVAYNTPFYRSWCSFFYICGSLRADWYWFEPLCNWWLILNPHSLNWNTCRVFLTVQYIIVLSRPVPTLRDRTPIWGCTDKKWLWNWWATPSLLYITATWTLTRRWFTMFYSVKLGIAFDGILTRRVAHISRCPYPKANMLGQ